MPSSDGMHDPGIAEGTGGGGNSGSDPLMSAASGHDLGSRSPNMTNSTLSDGTDFRVNAVMNLPDAAYAFNGRLSPSQFSGNTGSYATLTPLQPLPPIASVSEKFGTHNPVATPQGFHFITPNHQLSVHNITNTYQYATGSFAPLTAISAHQAATSIGGYTGAYSHNGLHSPKSFSPSNGFENHIALAAANSLNYPTPQRTNLAGSSSPFSSSNIHSNNGVSLTIQLASGLSVQGNVFGHSHHSQHQTHHSHESSENSHHHHDRNSPNDINGGINSAPGSPTSSPHSGNGGGHNNHNGQINVDNSPSNSVLSTTSHSHGSSGAVGNTNGNTGATHGTKHHAGHRTTSHSSSNIKNGNTAASSDEMEEINTKELAQRISAELKRYSIPQAIFAQRVLCRSQGTLSDLLRNPKPWSKLKSGRETFRRMAKWLEEPEFQRMSALRLAGKFHLI